MGKNVKEFLIEKFEMGERSGNKADPLSVSRGKKMRMANVFLSLMNGKQLSKSRASSQGIKRPCDNNKLVS